MHKQIKTAFFFFFLSHHPRPILVQTGCVLLISKGRCRCDVLLLCKNTAKTKDQRGRLCCIHIRKTYLDLNFAALILVSVQIFFLLLGGNVCVKHPPFRMAPSLQQQPYFEAWECTISSLVLLKLNFRDAM